VKITQELTVMPRRKKVSNIISASPPTKKEQYTLRILIILGVIAMLAFLYWFIDSRHVGHLTLFCLLTAALGFKLLRMVHEWYHYYSIQVPRKPRLNRRYTVDILTTYCPGEPHEMILTTLKAIQNITYPHTAYLCDEGDDPILRKACEEMGVVHVTRTKKTDAKAGNINNALRQATGEICVVLDPDHVPVPEFLDQVLPYFQDPEVGFVQVVQAYHNQRESLIARGAAEQTYAFYGPLMMSMSGYGTAQAIGANCTFRRKALDSIGGHAAGLAEDMHTSMRLHARGWKSVYVPEILSRGLVPATMSGYFKQQLKWARGSFDLLFYVFPALCKHFTWRQKIHYFTVPLYYLYGVFGLLDILLPVFSLVLAEAAWLVDLSQFTLAFLPVFVMSLLIRQYAQRWMLEKHEQGFHVFGGILRMGTWWIYTIGFIYTILRIKVPYIPTPKDDKPQNNILLSLPNLLACIISIAAVVYGLSRDFNPYSLLMAGFALVNAALLGFIVILGQEKLIQDVKQWLEQFVPVGEYLQRGKLAWWNIRHPMYSLLRNGALAISLLMIMAIGGYFLAENVQRVTLKKLAPPDMKDTGGFYTGIYLPSLDKDYSFEPVRQMSATMNTSYDIVSFYQAWGPESITDFPDSLLRNIHAQGGVPMITWEPWSSTFPQFAGHPDLSAERKICKAIYEGLFDEYIQAYALRVRDFGEPIFLRFAHEPDNPAYPWSPSGGNTPNEYVAAWQHVVTTFVDLGVTNVTWVWNPWSHAAIDAYFPGGKYVDWIGITCLNYGLASSDSKWYTFDELYRPYRNKLYSLQRPIMLAEFGSTSYGGDQEAWINNSLSTIREYHPEIKALVFFYTDKDKNWATDWRPENNTGYLDWTFRQPERTMQTANRNLSASKFTQKPLAKPAPPDTDAYTYSSKFVQGSPGNFQLLIDGQPFYIRGVAYNPAHDWRDGNIPLTRRQLEKDFAAIKAMGANTIRRYEPGLYDVNILTIAHEYDLKVMYGFWFDPKIDYYRDSVKVQQYLNEVETMVKRYRKYPSVLGWSLGNEAWGLLKHHYSQPYLTEVRQAYTLMIERMARRIHELDPDRPVFTAAEHAIQLPGEIHTFRQLAPSIDVMGINSYYAQQISNLDKIATQFDPARPYMVSEFGPRGYWDSDYSLFRNDTTVVEETSYEKAVWYTWQWSNYVVANQGNNIGGFAFCWRDRLEGSATWFGLTDFKGRKKPAYHALKRLWTDEQAEITTKPNYQIHDAMIGLPSGKIIPGKQYVFSAVSENKLWDGITYEWYLQREGILGYVSGVKPINGGKNAIVTIPDSPSAYRLYLYISDKEGNVVTTSEEIPVEWSKEPVFTVQN
jgi:cellulose synthase (UDP-forming)